MFQRKPVLEAKKLIWRLHDAQRPGDAADAAPSQLEGLTPHHAHDRWFRVSSLELARGTEVSETDFSDLPGEFADAFSTGAKGAPRR